MRENYGLKEKRNSSEEIEKLKMTGLEQFLNGLKLLSEDALSDKRTLFSHAVETNQDCYLQNPRDTWTSETSRWTTV